MNKTKLKAFVVCLIIITAAVCACVWAAASEPHGAVTGIYTDSGGGSYTLYADGHLAIKGYSGGAPEEGVLLLAGRVKSMELTGCTVTAESRPLFKEFKSLTGLYFTDTAFEGSMREMFSGCKSLEAVQFSDVSMSAVTDMVWMFSGCTALKSIDMSGTDLSNVKQMNLMFSGCTALESADFSGADLTGCENMTQLFEQCSSLKSVDMSGIASSEKMNAYRIFENCRSIETVDLTGFNFGKTSLYCFFADCSPKLSEVCLKDVDTSNVKAMNFMFSGCAKLKTLDLSDLDTGNVTDYHDMFNDCTGLEYLDVSGFDLTDTGVQMDRMFDGLVSLREIDLTGFKTAGVTNMYHMFYNCKSLEKLDLSGFDTSSVTNVSEMFTGCISLKELDVSGFDLSRVSSISYLFSGLKSLESIDLKGFKVMSGGSLMATNLFDGCRVLKYLDLTDTDLKNAMMYQAFNNVGFWELKLPETMFNPYPCFSGNTPPEKPYYTWDGDWSCFTDDTGNAVRDDVLQGSADVSSPEQICLDTVRIQNAGSAITIIPNFTPIEYGINISFVDGEGNELASDTKKYSIEDKEAFSLLDKEYAEKMCPGYVFSGFSSEELGITGGKEVPAPEVPCGDIGITVLMKLPEPETEPETTTEPEITTEAESGTSEDETEPDATAEPGSSEGFEGTTEAVTAETEETGTPESTEIPEDTKAPEETADAGTVETEPVTSPEGSMGPAETKKPESGTEIPGTSGTDGATEPETTTEPESGTSEDLTGAPGETETHGLGSANETKTAPSVTEPPSDETLSGTPDKDTAVNTGDKNNSAASYAVLISGLFLTVCAVLTGGFVRKGSRRRRQN